MVQGVKVERATVRTTLTPWGDCSALPGSKVVGMGAPRRSPRSGRHSRTVPLPSRSLSAPAGGILLKSRVLVLVSCPRAYPVVGARRRRQRRAGRRQERGRSQSREAHPAERSAAGCLGHTDPGFTLRIYTHLLPSSEGRARLAMDKVYLSRPSGPDGP